MAHDPPYLGITVLIALVAVAAVVLMTLPPQGMPRAGNAAGAAYTTGDTIPAWYAPPWDVFTDEPFLAATPHDGQMTVAVDRPGAWIYRTFFVSQDGAWQPHAFPGSVWSRDHAQQDVTVAGSGEEYVAVYTCVRNSAAPDGWDCGCKSTSDTACRAFALQSFTVTPEEPPASCDSSFSSCVAPPPGFPSSVDGVQPFADVPPSGWSAALFPVITTARALGITAGIGNDRFAPVAPASRGAGAVFLAKAFALPAAQGGAQSFTDVPPSSPFFQAVEAVHAAGLMNGYGDGTFGVDDNLTRAQLAVIVAAALGLDPSPYGTAQSFTDVPPGFWAHDSIEALHAADLIVGYGDGTYRPTQAATRAQALSVIMHGAFGFRSCSGAGCAKLDYDCAAQRLTLTAASTCTLDCTDNDGDGYNQSGAGCGPADCDDTNPAIHPGAVDRCGDGIDQDCSGADNACGGWRLVWDDEFTAAGSPDPAKWGYAIGSQPNWGDGLQYYTSRPENARVEDGHLIIESRKEQYEGYNYTSARLSTKNLAAWTYGRIEVRARLPGGADGKPGIGMKSAIWLMPLSWTYSPYDQGGHFWPDNGEIDIMENIGWQPTRIFSTIHRKPRNAEERSWAVQGTTQVTDPENEWHVYWMDWTPENMTLGVDDHATITLQNDGQGWEHWPFDQPFYLILSHPVADSWSTNGHTLPFDDSILPQELLVDYVRVYQECASDADCPAGETCDGACV